MGTGQTILVAPTTVYNGTSNSQVVISTKVLSIKSAVPGTYVRIVCPFSPTPPEALPGGHPFPEPGVPTGAGIVFTNGALNSSLEWFWFHGCSAGGVHLEGSRNVVALNHGIPHLCACSVALLKSSRVNCSHCCSEVQ